LTEDFTAFATIKKGFGTGNFRFLPGVFDFSVEYSAWLPDLYVYFNLYDSSIGPLVESDASV
jgi:hypothetical protein